MAMPTEHPQAVCVIVTHTIHSGRDAHFLAALRRLHESRRVLGLVTDRWLVLKDRDREDTYTQILEYVSVEAEERAEQSPELAVIRREIGAVSAGRPDHLWASVVLTGET
jgi:hypothetical protein